MQSIENLNRNTRSRQQNCCAMFELLSRNTATAMLASLLAQKRKDTEFIMIENMCVFICSLSIELSFTWSLYVHWRVSARSVETASLNNVASGIRFLAGFSFYICALPCDCIVPGKSSQFMGLPFKWLSLLIRVHATNTSGPIESVNSPATIQWNKIQILAHWARHALK